MNTQNLRACPEIRFWVAQATGLCRPATRRAERGARPEAIKEGLLPGAAAPFRSAGRRPARAGRPCSPFSGHALVVVRNGSSQGRTMQRLDSVGESPTGASESPKGFGPLPFPSPRLRVSGKIFTYLRLSPLIPAYHRLTGEKCLRTTAASSSRLIVQKERAARLQ